VRTIAEDLGIAENLLYNWRKKYTAAGEKTPMATMEEEQKRSGWKSGIENGARHAKKRSGLLCEAPEVKYSFIFEHPEYPKAKRTVQMKTSKNGY